MRTLRIFRQKTFTACLVTMQVYITDPVGDLQIDNIPCRKLGTLKNGKESVFTIPQEACTIFVIGDKLSRNYCNAYYNIPAGSEEISLSGKNHLDPVAGNPFRFDGAENQPALSGQTKSAASSTKRGRILFFGAVAFGLLAGLLVPKLFTSSKKVEPKTFTDSGITITLTEDFEKDSQPGFAAAYKSNKAMVLVVKEDFAYAPYLADYTIEEYGELFLDYNRMNNASIKQTQNGQYYFEYEATVEENGITYYYYCTLHRSEDAFWVVNFCTLAPSRDTMRPLFEQWSQTVTFPKSS